LHIIHDRKFKNATTKHHAIARSRRIVYNANNLRNVHKRITLSHVNQTSRQMAESQPHVNYTRNITVIINRRQTVAMHINSHNLIISVYVYYYVYYYAVHQLHCLVACRAPFCHDYVVEIVFWSRRSIQDPLNMFTQKNNNLKL